MTVCLDRPGHTAEMTIFGTRYILTEEPENIKAIFTSQVDLMNLFSTSSADSKGSSKHMAKAISPRNPSVISLRTPFLRVRACNLSANGRDVR
jgi:hypothetical protein